MKTLFTAALLLNMVFAFAQAQQFNVNFDFGQSALTIETAHRLDSFLLLKDNNTQVKLYGHCDSVGGNIENDPLSDKRVEAVKTYLIVKGFNRDNIIETKGFGKRKPLNNNSTSYERHINRRVEIIISHQQVQAAQQPGDTSTLTEKINDTLTKTGTTIVLRNLNFYGGLHDIIPQSVPVVQELVDVMKKNPTLQIAIEGHICCQPGPGDGMDMETRTANLSENRAKAIYDLLVENGIDSNRVSYKGFGHQNPLVAFPEKTEEEKTSNRRVEIKIVKR